MSTTEIELDSTTQFIPIEETEEAEEFSCPVCYTDGKTSGLVNPSKCTHPICLECYTNIATRSPSPTCPICRTQYLNTSPETQDTQAVTPTQSARRPISPNMDSDLMSLLIHNTLPEYSFRNTLLDSIIAIERTNTILELLSS